MVIVFIVRIRKINASILIGCAQAREEFQKYVLTIRRNT
jgi:hypothetical protein